MRELGGRPEYYQSLQMYQVQFGEQGLDLWVHAVEPPGSQSRLEIEGREETVLSNVQILWGKIARAERNLSRDVYDARRHPGRPDAPVRRRKPRPDDRPPGRPTCLEIALNAHPRGVAEWAARSWDEGSAEVASDARTRLRGIPTAEREQLDTLALRGMRTIKAALYEELTMRTAGDYLQIETRTAGGVQRRIAIKAGSIREALTARGLTGNRRRHGPNMEALIGHAEELCRTGAAKSLIYREDAQRATHWRTATAAQNYPLGRQGVAIVRS